jgi:hypothetical protein
MNSDPKYRGKRRALTDQSFLLHPASSGQLIPYREIIFPLRRGPPYDRRAIAVSRLVSRHTPINECPEL